MAEQAPNWAKAVDAPDWTKVEAPEQPVMLEEAVKQAQSEAVTGAKKGLIGGLGAGGDISELVGPYVGGPQQRVLPTSQEVGQFLERLGVMTPPKPDEPSSKPIEFMTNPLSWLGPGSGLAKLMSAIGGGVGSEVGGKVAGAPGEVIGGVVGGIMPKGAGKVVTPSKEIAANRQAAADYLAKEGVTDVSAAQLKGSKAERRAESQFGTAAFAGDVASERYNSSLRQYTKAALRRVGEDSDVATRDVIDRAFTRIGAEFDRLQANTLVVDQTLRDEIRSAWQDYRNTTEPGKIVPYAKDIVDAFERYPTSVGVSGEHYKALRSQLDRVRRGTTSPEYKNVLSDYIKALDGAMERTLKQVNPADVGKWKEARRQYRNMLVIEKARPAGELGAEGVITPAKLRQASNSVNKRWARRGKDDFSDLVDAGELIMTPLSTSQTTERAAIHAIPMATLAGVGELMAGNPAMAAGIAGGMVLPGMTGRAMFARPVQNWMKNQAAIEYLKQQPPATLSAIRSLLVNLGDQNAGQ